MRSLSFLLGQPSFSYACFDNTLYEYDADWTIDEKCFLVTSRVIFKTTRDYQIMKQSIKNITQEGHQYYHPFGNLLKLTHRYNQK
jgi:hypothetical protein